MAVEWRVEDPLWYAAMIDAGEVYGLMRRVVRERGRARIVDYERLDRATGEWVPDPSRGAAVFTGIGGVTDAVPVSVADGDALTVKLAPGGSR